MVTILVGIVEWFPLKSLFYLWVYIAGMTLFLRWDICAAAIYCGSWTSSAWIGGLLVIWIGVVSVYTRVNGCIFHTRRFNDVTHGEYSGNLTWADTLQQRRTSCSGFLSSLFCLLDQILILLTTSASTSVLCKRIEIRYRVIMIISPILPSSAFHEQPLMMGVCTLTRSLYLQAYGAAPYWLSKKRSHCDCHVWMLYYILSSQYISDSYVVWVNHCAL